jgi:hypothetical protein
MSTGRTDVVVNWPWIRKKVEIFSVVEILYICKIKTKTTTDGVGVYKQIAGLYVIDF